MSQKEEYKRELKQVLRGVESRKLLIRLYEDLLSAGERPDMIEVSWMGELYKAEMLDGKLKVKSCGIVRENPKPEKKCELAVKPKIDAYEHDTYKIMEGVDVAALQAKINALYPVQPTKELTKQIGKITIDK
jgi:hypothetical protein